MLRASCPLQYEAVMDRVQKSKLSLHKKAMEVSLEGWLGLGCGSQEPWDRAGLRLPSSNRHSGLSGSWMPGAAATPALKRRRVLFRGTLLGNFRARNKT